MRTLMVVIAAIAFVGCGGSEQPEAETGQSASDQQATIGGEAEAQQTAMSENCPMHVQGTTVTAEDVEGGAALVFITTSDTDMLRERVRNMAAFQESNAMGPESQRMGMSETMRPGSADDTTAGAKQSDDAASATGPMDPLTSPDVDTHVEDVEGGARLVITATSPADVETVRADAQRHAQHLSAGECPMSSHSMQPSSMQ
jgi:hypothetical protein